MSDGNPYGPEWYSDRRIAARRDRQRKQAMVNAGMFFAAGTINLVVFAVGRTAVNIGVALFCYTFFGIWLRRVKQS